MYSSPLVIGIDRRSVFVRRPDVQGLLAAYGNNTGNILFSEALYRSLHGARCVGFHFIYTSTERLMHSLVEGRDAFVIAAANWLNPYDDLGWLADRLERFKLPIVIVGVGAQSDPPTRDTKIHEGTLRFLRLAADSSVSISTRGGFSAEILRSHGIHNLVVTGCPSLLLNGMSAPTIRACSGASNNECAIHSTRHIFDDADSSQSLLYRHALNNKIDLVLQSELADMYYVLNGGNPIFTDCDEILSRVYGGDINIIRDYLKTHARIFFELEPWLTFFRSKKFVYGTRLHATIVALLAGTPATLIVHDYRTLEAAQVMNIPHIQLSAVNLSEDVGYRALYDDQQIQRFIAGYAHYLENFLGFFNINGLEMRSDHMPNSSGTAGLWPKERYEFFEGNAADLGHEWPNDGMDAARIRLHALRGRVRGRQNVVI